MAKYKHYDLNQTKMIPLSYADQVVEGSFEHARLAPPSRCAEEKSIAPMVGA